MKRLLLSLSLICALSTNAQVLLTEDSSTLTVGNIGTDTTGATPGQGGWLTSVGTTGSNASFQVVDKGAPYGNAIQIIGSNTATGSRFMTKNLSSVWASRTSGNDIAQVEFEFFTGPVTTSANTMRIMIFDTPDRANFLGGLMITMNTLVISGLSSYDNAGTVGNYSFKLGTGGTDIVLSPNTWYKFGFSFNNATGEVIFRESTGLFNGSLPGASAFLDLAQIDILSTAGTGNTVASTGVFDNVKVEATADDTLLLASPTFNTENKFSVYPNPVKDVVTVRNTENIAVNGITITDLNGRTVKTVNYNNISDNIQVNVSDLSSGVYMMNIKSDKGSVTKKIVKN